MNNWSNKTVAFLATGWPWPKEGGSGLRKILEQVESGSIQVKKILIVSWHKDGWVESIYKEFSKKLNNIVWEFQFLDNFPKRQGDNSFSTEDTAWIRNVYKTMLDVHNPDYVFLSGWIKHVLGIDLDKLINIHPWATWEPYWWIKKYWDKVHDEVWWAYERSEIKRTCVTMHFADEDVDTSKYLIAQVPVEIDGCETQKEMKARVNQMEHQIQWIVTKAIIEWDIYLNSQDLVIIKDSAKLLAQLPSGTILWNITKLDLSAESL